jgi:DNA-binding NarL/FixJ family response regulator
MATIGDLVSMPGRDSAGRQRSDMDAYRLLTNREQQVFSSLAQGMPVAEVARRLGRSVKTVENHRTAIYQKLGLADRLELVDYARRLGLLI